MHVLEAKDFLVQQTEQQARIERISLSDLEKRMMYYAEGKDASKGDSELNDEFDAQYNTADYEIKIGRLLQHAYVCLKETAPETARRWDDSIAFLGKGHHYIRFCGTPNIQPSALPTIFSSYLAAPSLFSA
jgi:hypothetical protein